MCGIRMENYIKSIPHFPQSEIRQLHKSKIWLLRGLKTRMWIYYPSRRIKQQ